MNIGHIVSYAILLIIILGLSIALGKQNAANGTGGTGTGTGGTSSPPVVWDNKNIMWIVWGISALLAIGAYTLSQKNMNFYMEYTLVLLHVNLVISLCLVSIASIKKLAT